MKFFVDTADVAALRELNALGPVAGVAVLKGLDAFLKDRAATGRKIL